MCAKLLCIKSCRVQTHKIHKCYKIEINQPGCTCFTQICIEIYILANQCLWKRPGVIVLYH